MQITAAVARAKNAPLSLEEVSLAEPRADEVLVRLVAAGICHTDISMRDHIIYPVPHPVVLGHEGAGIVERIGAGVTRLAAGDPVILTSASCGHCPSCNSGLPIYCYEFNDRNFTGTRIDGSSPLSKGGEIIHYYQGQSSFATHAVIRERSVVKVPKEAPLEMLAPLGCGIMTGAGAVINSLGVGIDNSVAVFGTGSVGLSAIMAAKLVGRRRRSSPWIWSSHASHWRASLAQRMRSIRRHNRRRKPFAASCRWEWTSSSTRPRTRMCCATP